MESASELHVHRLAQFELAGTLHGSKQVRLAARVADPGVKVGSGSGYRKRSESDFNKSDRNRMRSDTKSLESNFSLDVY